MSSTGKTRRPTSAITARTTSGSLLLPGRHGGLTGMPYCRQGRPVIWRRRASS
jgi:hypothetical protein